jgi:RNA polymerase sigma factor (sigma-70 family)
MQPFDPLEKEDALQAGLFAFIRAVDSFDPAKGVKLTTYGTVLIHREVWAERDRARPIRVSRDMVTSIRALYRALEQLSNQGILSPSDAELGVVMGVAESVVSKTYLAIRNLTPERLDALLVEMDDVTLTDTLIDPQAERAYDHCLERLELERKITLTKDERIRRMIAFLRDDPSLTEMELAELLSVSQPTINRWLKKLRAPQQGEIV